MKAYQLKIQDKKQETAQAVSLTFAVTEALKADFAYKAGQYLTIEAEINGEKVRRAYSMSSSPAESSLPTITVKKVMAGKMSNYLCNEMKAGSSITVFPPEGRFVLEANAENEKYYALFGAGSGITPLMSILKTVLKEEPKSKITLFYGNRNVYSIIFKEELDFLAQKYPEQLDIIHYLSKADSNWQGKKGRIDTAQTEYLINAYLTDLNKTEAFICGPNNMIENVEKTLKSKGLATEKIHKEFFVVNTSDEESTQKESIPSDSNSVKITFKFDDETHTLEGSADKSILDSIIEAGHEVPYSCQAGACCSCMALLTEGDASLDTQDMLTAGEKEEGLRLTCQAKPLTQSVFVDFDEA